MASDLWVHFDQFSVNTHTAELRRGNRPVPLERQPALVLAKLVASRGDLVTRRQLCEALWPAGTHVDFDRGLNYCLRQVRLALGDDARRPRFVETIPRQGYRLIAAVNLPTQPSRRHPQRRVAAIAAGVVLATAALEFGPGNETHHEVATAVVRTLHDWIF